MTIDQKKISLINWIATIDDESVLDQVVSLQKSSIEQLPEAIIQLLKIADSERDDQLSIHTSAREVLK